MKRRVNNMKKGIIIGFLGLCGIIATVMIYAMPANILVFLAFQFLVTLAMWSAIIFLCLLVAYDG